MSKRCHYPIRSVFEGRSFQIDLERVPSKEIGTSLVHWLLNKEVYNLVYLLSRVSLLG